VKEMEEHYSKTRLILTIIAFMGLLLLALYITVIIRFPTCTFEHGCELL